MDLLKTRTVAEYSTELIQTPQVSCLTSDHLGSPRVITDQTGQVTNRKDYMAFGEETISTQRTTQLKYENQTETRKGYTGYEKDTESGLDFAQARYYNSSHGRYTSVDPLTASANVKNPQTFNRYTYVLNSPYKYTDPLGLISVTTGACGNFCPGNNGGAMYSPKERKEEESATQQHESAHHAEATPPPPTAESNEDTPPPCAAMERARRDAEENKKRGKKNEEKKVEQPEPTPNNTQEYPDDGGPNVSINTEIGKDLKILKISVKYIDEDNTGQVPIGGKFSITFRFSISTPQEGDVQDLSSYGGIVSSSSGAFEATENLGVESSTTEKIGVKGTSTIIEKTVTYRVLPDKNSKLGGRSGTRAINFFVFARNPESAGGRIICEGSNSRSGKYVEVRIP